MKHLLLISLLWIAAAQQNYEYRGKIVDAVSGETLAGVNVYLENGVEGTASDIDGNFRFFTTQKNPTVKVSYVGYKTREIRLTGKQTIRLEQDVFTDAIVVVTANGLTKAQRIIVNTIENYQERFKTVDEFETEVYSKVFFYFPKNKKDSLRDDSLRRIGQEDEIRARDPWVFESFKRVNWKQPNKISQTILKRNQGKALPAMFNVLGVVNYQNAFNDQFMDQNSPLNNDYFWDFDYQYRGKIVHNGDSAFVIHASRLDTSHVWLYKMIIGDQQYDLRRIEVAQKRTSEVRSSLRISPFMRIRNSKNVTVMQDYARQEGITIPKNYTITRISERGVIRMAEQYQNFQINDVKTEVAFTERQFNIAPDVDDVSDTLWQRLRPQPLNALEERAYVKSDSLYGTYDPWERFMFDRGLKFMFFDYYIGKYKLTGIGDIYHFSPVEGHVLGIGLEGPSTDIYRWQFNLGYATGMEKLVGQASLDFPVSHDWDLRGKLSVFHKKQQLNPLTFYFPTAETMSSLFSHESDYNHLLNVGYELDITRRITNEFSYALVYRNQEYRGLDNTSEFSLFNTNQKYEPNLRVPNTRENELGIRLNYDESFVFDLPPFKMKRRKENAWQIETEITFNANNAEAMRFKRATASIFKQNDLTRFTRLNFNSDIYYVGKAVGLSNMFFPRTTNFFNRKFEYSLAGFNGYKKGTFDYASLGASLRMRRFFDFIDLRRLGTLTLFGQAFTMNNHDVAKLADVEIRNTKLDFNYGAAIENTLFFMPLRFVWFHNTLLDVNEYKVTFGVAF